MPLSFGFAKGQVIATRVQSPMILEIDTTRSVGTTYDINFSTPTGGVSPNFTIDWGDGTVQNFTTVGTKSRTYASAGTYQIRISGAVGGIGWGYNISNLTNNNKLTKIIDFGNITRLTSLSGLANQSRLTAIATNLPSTVTDISSFFLRASTFNLDVSAWNTSNITNMNNTFSQASVFNQNIGAWDVSKVTDMNSMFASATAFNNGGGDTIKNWNTAACTNMQYMFYQALAFNQPIGSWNTGNVTRMIYMFGSDIAGMTFNKNIGAWNVSKNQFFSQMFSGNAAFNNEGSADINNWALYSGAGTVDFFRMFLGASTFNQPIGNWNVSRVLNMSQAFQGAAAFNQNIGSWNTATCNNMYNMFAGATAFNNGGSNTIGSWNTSNVTSMTTMFSGATTFNQNIGAWNTSKVTGISGMFSGATAFNNGGSPDINNWDTSKCISPTFRDMFNGATSFNQPIHNWSWASAGGDSDRMFKGATSFNNGGQPLSWTSLGNTTSLVEAFQNATSFNQNIGTWNVSTVTSFGATFNGATAFNNGGSPDINNWNTSNVTNMASMFSSAITFNQPVGSWNVSKVTDMQSMFSSARAFNNGGLSTINNWNTGLVTNMANMFFNAKAFNQPIGSWNTANVVFMNNMFSANTLLGATQYMTFDQNIGSWNVSKVTTFSGMFSGASAAIYNKFNNGGSDTIKNWVINTTANVNMSLMFRYNSFFNQPIGSWNTSRVTDMNAMLQFASLFNQNVGTWALNNSVNLAALLENSGMSYANYSRTLVGWANYVASTGNAKSRSFSIGAGVKYTGSKYSSGTYQNAKTARTYLTTALASGGGWTITDGGDAAMRLHIDPNNSDCYAGSGTTITDLSDLGANGTMMNGFGFDSVNKFFTTTQTAQRVDFTQTAANSLSNTSYTKCVWANITTTAYNNLLSGGGNAQHAMWANNGANITTGHNNSWSLATVGGISYNNWQFFVVTFSTTSGMKGYLNGSLVNSNAAATGAFSKTGNGELRLNSYTALDNGIIGKYGVVQAYNTELPAAEIARIYNETKSAYGL